MQKKRIRREREQRGCKGRHTTEGMLKERIQTEMVSREGEPKEGWKGGNAEEGDTKRKKAKGV